MATVGGNSESDFIHQAGDGLVAPPGFHDVTGVTDGGDTINGKGGDDIIHAGNGSNTITGGLGTDALYGGDNFDLFLINSNEEIDGLSEIIDGGAGDNRLLISTQGGELDLTHATLSNLNLLACGSYSTESINVVLTQDQLSQFKRIASLSSNPESNITISGPGTVTLNDVLINARMHFFGSSGDDTFLIDGASENTSINLGAGKDILKFNMKSSNFNDSIFTFHGDTGNDTISSTAGLNHLFGDDGDDRLAGGVKFDMLDGGSGGDRLDGGGKADTLTGGTGADMFVYGKAKFSEPGKNKHDTITDFSQAEGDRIDIHKIDADTTLAGDQAFHLGGSAFSNSAGEIIQFSDGLGNTMVQADLNGDGNADFELVLSGAATLTGSDFLL